MDVVEEFLELGRQVACQLICIHKTFPANLTDVCSTFFPGQCFYTDEDVGRNQTQIP